MMNLGLGWERWHVPLCLISVLILLLGGINLDSATAAHHADLLTSHWVWIGCGLLLVGVWGFVDFRWTEPFVYLFYLIVCGLLVLVLWQGRDAGGARRWLQFGAFGFQPSELAKLALVFCLARFMSHRTESQQPYSLRTLLRPLNLSRPLAMLLLLLLSWDNPWLVAPLRQLSLVVVRFVDVERPALGDVMWLRVFLLIGCIVFSLGMIVWTLRLARLQALLAPWSRGRLTFWIFCWLSFGLLGIGGVVVSWQAAWLKDPLGGLLGLFMEEASLGVVSLSSEGIFFRVCLLLGVGIYVAVSVWHMFAADPDDSAELWIAPVDLVALPALLILLEPDLGTACMLVLIGLSMVWVVGLRWRSMLVMAAMGICMGAVSWLGILKNYQKQRILTFLSPESDLYGAGWNAVQSIIAVGSGRWLGKGHRGGTQTQLSFLPEQHTDFAFSVWAEEHGFIGSISLLLLYAVLLLLMLRVASRARSSYGALLVVGVAAMAFWHVLINVGMVIGVAPVVGLTLPLFSYGGSSLLTTMFTVGLVCSVDAHARAAEC